MFSRKFYRAPDDDGGGSAGDDAAEIAALEKEAQENNENIGKDPEEPKAMGEDNKFKIEDLEAQEVEKKSDDDNSGEEKGETGKDDKKDPEAKQDKSGKEKTGDPEKKKAPEKKDDSTDGDEPVFEIKPVAESEKPEQESTWKDLGVDLGLDMKDDSYESFRAAYDEKLKQQPVADEEKVFNSRIEKLDPEAKNLFEFLQNGGKLQDYINPIRQYDELLALSDEAIVTKSLELQKWDKDAIEKKLQLLKEEGKLDTEAYGLRKSVETAKTQRVSALEKQQADSSAAERTRESAKRNKEDVTIIESLNKVEKFMGGKLSKESRDVVAKRWQSGYYRQKFAEDPDFVINAILSYELKEQMLETTSKKSFDKGLHKNQDKLHNTKSLNSSEAGSRSAKEIKVEGEGHFSGWRTALD